MIIENKPKFLGVGTDIENVDRFYKFNNENNKFLKKIFTKNELSYCFSKKDAANHLAARYTGKEAIIKAINNLDQTVIEFKDIEILNDKKGAPFVKLYKQELKDIDIKISLSHCKDKATAFAIAVKTKNCKG